MVFVGKTCSPLLSSQPIVTHMSSVLLIGSSVKHAAAVPLPKSITSANSSKATSPEYKKCLNLVWNTRKRSIYQLICYWRLQFLNESSGNTKKSGFMYYLWIFVNTRNVNALCLDGFIIIIPRNRLKLPVMWKVFVVCDLRFTKNTRITR